jgi:hypothetical protein
MTASLQLGATKHQINGSKLTNTHVNCAQLLGGAVYVLLMVRKQTIYQTYDQIVSHGPLIPLSAPA